MSPNSPPRARLRARTQTPVIDLTSSPLTEVKPPRPVQPVPVPAFALYPLPTPLTTAHTKLSPSDHRLLLKKQTWLQNYSVATPRYFRKHAAAVSATLVFAQEEAGTAVCVHPSGLLLTCAHCVADENDEAPDPKTKHWLVFASGLVVAALCVAWDGRRDLSLLKIVATQGGSTGAEGKGFPSVKVADTGPMEGDKLVCVGHPGSEDLEVADAGVKTGYDVLHFSTGVFRGYAEGQDLQDNSEIGALQHDCWTYWGHSGAPLFARGSGTLVGLHSSWDDVTAMRRGVAWEAIVAFLEEHPEASKLSPELLARFE